MPDLANDPERLILRQGDPARECHRQTDGGNRPSYGAIDPPPDVEGFGACTDRS
jgi:hypothetical protein